MKIVLFFILIGQLSFSFANEQKKTDRKPSSELDSVFCEGKSGVDKFVLELCFSRSRKKGKLEFTQPCSIDQSFKLTENGRQISKDSDKVVSLSILLVNDKSSLTSDIKDLSFRVLKSKNEVASEMYYSENTGWNTLKYESISGNVVTRKLSTEFKCITIPKE